jgi:hypothetical protein
MCHRIEQELIGDILQVQKIQKEAENGCEGSVFRLKRRTRSLVPGEEDAQSVKKRRKTDQHKMNALGNDENEENEGSESINPEGDIINNTLATLAAALVWLALQSDELVSSRKYTQRDLIHSLYDFERHQRELVHYNTYGNGSVKGKKESSSNSESSLSVAASSSELDSNNTKLSANIKHESKHDYNEDTYKQKRISLEKLQMHCLRLLNFNVFPSTIVLPSVFLNHWASSFLDHRYRPGTSEREEFLSRLFVLYKDTLQVGRLWKSDNFTQTRKNLLTIFYLTIKLTRQVCKFEDIQIFAPEVSFKACEEISKELLNYF